ncbi:uncharacterized protein O3C94_013674 [Discoglossus pictus]
MFNGDRRPDTRRPITFALLLRMAQVLEVKCRTPFESLLFRTAFSLAFFGAFRIGEEVVLHQVGTECCPYGCMVEYLGKRPVGRCSLLVHADGTALSRYQFERMLKVALHSLGIKGSDFGTHSFRIGAATEAARLGLPDAAVKRIGRWESERFRSYVRPSL